MAMQEDLRLAQPHKGDDRLAMRVVITLGMYCTRKARS